MCVLSNRLFHFSYKSLNAPSENIMFLWNFCHLFPVLFYDWNKSITDSFWFFRGFSRNHFLEGCFTFQCGRDCFSDREALFLSECKGGRGGGGAPWGALVLMQGFSKKIIGWGSTPSPSPLSIPPTKGNSVFIFLDSTKLKIVWKRIIFLKQHVPIILWYFPSWLISTKLVIFIEIK